MMSFSISLLAILMSAHALGQQETPDNNTDLQARQMVAETPCNCYFKDSCGCVCPRPISWAAFQLLPQNFRPCRAFTLALRGGQFHSFPGDYFQRVGHVNDFVMDVSTLSMQYLHDPQSESSPYNGVTFDTSAYIRVHQVTVSREWNWGAMYWLAPTSPRAYCEIQVVQSTVPVLKAGFGRICQGAVTVADVRNSGVMTIEDKTFAPFARLVELDLSGNRIEDMKRSQLPYPAAQLQVINLANNNIKTLPQDMFSGMPALQSVNLRGNPVSALDDRTFRPIFHTVEIVGLESLPLFCDCKARWLKEPAQLCGANVYGLAAAVCNGPKLIKGYSFFNDTLPKDLVC